MPDPILVAHCEYVAGADGLVTFTVTGAPGEVSWRFGDATDEAASADGVTEHTYSAGGTYEAIGHVHSTGQRMVMTVGVPEYGGGITTPTLTAVTPDSIPVDEESTFIVTGTGFEVGIEMMFNGIGGGLGVYTWVDDTTVTWTITPSADNAGTGQITARNRPDPEGAPGPISNSLPITITAPPPPVITSLDPATAPINVPVDLTVIGTDFGANALLFIDGSPTVPTSNTPTNLTATFTPDYLGPLQIFVNQGGQQSNEMYLEVT